MVFKHFTESGTSWPSAARMPVASLSFNNNLGHEEVGEKLEEVPGEAAALQVSYRPQRASSLLVIRALRRLCAQMLGIELDASAAVMADDGPIIRLRSRQQRTSALHTGG